MNGKIRKIRMALGDEDIHICRDHVRRLMRMMGIEAIYPKQRFNTSEPDSAHHKYPYLLNGITASFPNHIWCTDITYVRLESGWAYLVALLDWFSRIPNGDISRSDTGHPPTYISKSRSQIIRPVAF